MDRASSSLIPVMMPFVAPLVVETPEVTSKLVLANVSTEPAVATVTLFSADGTKSSSQRISFLPNEKKEISLASPQSAMNTNARWSSVTVEQEAGKMGVIVAGQVLMTDLRASTPAYLDEELAMPEATGSSQLSAVTDQSEGPPMVAITNLSSTPQQVSLTCLHDAEQPLSSSITIAAHATATSMGCSGALPSLADYTSSIQQGSHAQGVYGLHIQGDGAPGSLAAFAMAPHFRGQDLIFSSVPFYDPQMMNSSDVVFAGVPIGPQPTLPNGIYVPRLSYANFSNAPIHLTVYLADTEGTATGDYDNDSTTSSLTLLKSITVPAHQSGEFAFSAQEAQNGLQHSVVVKSDSSPGAYQAKLVSRSDGSLYQVELLAKDAMDINDSGIHPWTVEGDNESHLILFNHSSEAKKVGFTIFSGATSWTHEFMLAASETSEISFNDLETNHTKDDSGLTLPSSAKEGVVDWMTPESGDVTGRLMVTSRNGAMARNFSCGAFKSECGLLLDTFFSDIADGDTSIMYQATGGICINSQPLECANVNHTTGTVNYYWNVGATSIIKLNASAQQTKQGPLLKGVSPGQGTATVTASAGACQSSGGGNPNVTPKVDISGPGTLPLAASGTAGAVNTATLTATGTPGGGQYKWSRTSGSSVTLSTTTGSSVKLTSTSAGTTDVEVTYTLNGVPATKIVAERVQQPTSVSIYADTGTVQDVQCLNSSGQGIGYYGDERHVTYSTLDQSGTAIPNSGMPTAESFNITTNTCSSTPVPVNGATTNGGFTDHFQLCSNACLPANSNLQPTGSCELQATHIWKVNGFQVFNHTLTYTCTTIAPQ